MLVAKRYARALLEAVVDTARENQLEKVVSDLKNFYDLYATSDVLRDCFENPVFRNERLAVLKTIMQKLESHVLVEKLIQMLVEKQRMLELDEVVVSALELLSERKKVVDATVWTAITLTDVQKQRISKALSKHMGQPVVIHEKVDTTLMAGLVCQVGNTTIDHSLSRHLKSLGEQWSATEIQA